MRNSQPGIPARTSIPRLAAALITLAAFFLGLNIIVPAAMPVQQLV